MGELNLTRFDPSDNKQRIQILEFIVSELQDAMIGNKGKKQQSFNNIKSKKEQSNKSKKQKKKKKKSGKFRQCMDKIGHIFLEFNDQKTISKLIQIKSLSFIRRNKNFSAKQRLIAYTEPNDIIFRLKSFNAKCNALSSLKLYEIKKAPKTMSTLKLIDLMICNGLLFENRFKGKYENDHFVAMDLSRTKKYDFTQKVIKEKCKVLSYPKLLSYLWIFIELNSTNRREKNKKDIQQFMVWKGQCGEKTISFK